MLSFLGFIFAAVWGLVGLVFSALAFSALIGLVCILFIPALLFFGLLRVAFGVLQVAAAAVLIGALAIFFF